MFTDANGRLRGAVLIGSAAALAGAPGQVTVTSDQLGYEIGVEMVYLTHAADGADVTGHIGGEGGPQHWDFSEGPDDDRFRERAIHPADSGVAGPFPGASIARESTFDSTGGPAWSFYNLTEAGRELHGFHDAATSPASPAVVLTPPVVDFIATMQFGADWATQTSYPSKVDVPGFGTFDVVNNVTASIEVDAHGTAELPSLGTVEVIRLEEITTTSSVADVGGMPLTLADAFVRSYYWLSPAYGIVAQITSEASTELPEREFTAASRYLRLESRTDPEAVSVGPLQVQAIGGTLLLTWQASGAESFEVQVSEDMEQGSWQVRATVSEPRYIDLVTETALYYRVVALGGAAR